MRLLGSIVLAIIGALILAAIGYGLKALLDSRSPDFTYGALSCLVVVLAAYWISRWVEKRDKARQD